MKYLKTITFGLLLIVSFINVTVSAQVGIGTNDPDASSMLDVNSTDKGFLPPRMTEAERDLIGTPSGTPSAALLIYNTTTSRLNYFDGSIWQVVMPLDDVVDKSTNQTIAGNKTFTGMVTAGGRLMLPMGELSFFDFSGFTVLIPNQSAGVTGTDNMVKIDPTVGGTLPLEVPFVNDVFGTGTNGRLTYQGTVARYFHIALSFSYTPGTRQDVYVFGVAKNGTVEDSSKLFIKTAGLNDHQSSAMHVLLWLEPNEYIEFFVGNTETEVPASGSSILIKTINFFAMGM